MLKKRYIYFTIVVITIIGLGFFRETLFQNINIRLDQLNDQNYGKHLLPFFKFLNQFSLKQLSIAKWVLTFIFSGIFMGLNMISFFILFRERRYVWFTGFAYLLIFITAFFITAVGYAFGSFETAYVFARKLMGWLQSPVIFIVLLALILIERKLIVKE